MRCAVTGFGIVSSLGTGIPAFRDALASGHRNVAVLTGMRVPHGKGRFALSSFPDSPDRSARMSMCAVQEALSMAQCPSQDTFNAALVVGSVWAETQAAESAYADLVKEELSPATYRALELYPAGTLVDAIATAADLHGPRLIFNNACASSNIALGQALDLVRREVCRVAIVVGVDRFSLPGLWGAERSGFVGRDLQPFDLRRRGTVLGEGAAVMVIEAETESSRHRARAWLEGYACVCEPGAAAITLGEAGIGLQMSMRGALADAGRDLSEIDYVNAHAPGTPLIDLVECRAVAALWREQARTPAVNATKSLTGHMSGASAIAEAIATVLQMEDGFLHGNIGLEQLDPNLPVLVMPASAEPAIVRHAISNACGGGGLNTSVILAAKETSRTESRTPTRQQRVVITGTGALQAPARAVNGTELSWFDVHRWIPPETNIASMNRSAWIGGSVGVMAVEQSGLTLDDEHLRPQDVAVIGGVWLGGWSFASAALCEGLQHDPVEIFPSTALNNFGAHIASMMLCRRFGFTGPTHTVCGSTFSGLQALAVALGLLQSGRSRAAVVTGYDSDDVWLRRAAAWMPSARPLQDFREGGAGLVLENEASARRRNAHVLGIVHASAMTSGPLEDEDDFTRSSDAILWQLQAHFDHIVLCGPSGLGMHCLARALQRQTGAELHLPGKTHSLAGEGILAVTRHLKQGSTLYLGGHSGSGQVAIAIGPFAEQ